MEISKNSTRSNGEIPKTLIYFFLIAQLFGIDMGFTMVLKKKFGSLVQYLTLFLAITFVIILAVPALNLYKEFWFWLNLMEYFAYFIALNATKYNAYNFIMDINEIYDIKVREKKMLSGITILYTSAIVSMQVFFVTAYCVNNNAEFVAQFYTTYYYVFYCIPCLGLNFIVITKMIVIYYVYCCIKDLKHNFVNSRISLEMVYKQYIEIADVYDKIRPMYDNITIIQLVIGVPKMMGTLWYLLLYIKLNAQWFWYMNELVFVIHVITTICLPSIVSEMVKAQIDVVILNLHGMLMTNTDEYKSTKILHLLRYLKARSLQYKTWRVFPMDAQLLLALFSVCTTYFIVVIQFTHLYDQ